MDCKATLQLLSAYYDDQLDQSERADIESHLATCPSCSETFHALKNLPDLIRAIPPEDIPDALRRQIEIKIRDSQEINKNIRLESANMAKRLFRRYATIILTLFTMSLIIVIFSIILFLRSDFWQSDSLGLREFIAPQGVTMPDPLQETPGIGLTNQHAGSNLLRPINYLSKPEVTRSNKHYAKNEIETVAINPAVVKFAQEYRILEADAYRETLIAEMVRRANKQDQEAKALSNSIKAALSAIKKLSVPSYAEEASVCGKKAWVICVNWGDGSKTTPLSRIAVLAIDPSTTEIIDSWPPALLNMDYIMAGVNPHKTITCMACHPNFDTLKPSYKRSEWWKSTARIACIRCHAHKKQYAVYAKSIHGRLSLNHKLGKNKRPAPTCIDCHMGHTTLALKKITRKKGMLHAQAKRICGDCHKDRWVSYNDYYHGKAYKANAPDAPVCWDCHGSHDIQPADHTDSRVADTNLPKTCKKCHDGAARDFVQYGKLVHGYKRELITDIVRQYVDKGLNGLKKAAGSVEEMFK